MARVPDALETTLTLRLILSSEGRLDFLGGYFLGAEEPVFAVDVTGVAFKPVLGGSTRACRRNDHRLPRTPISKGRNFEVVSCLQGFDNPEYFVEIAAEAKRIVDDCAHDSYRIDDEYCLHCSS